MKTNRGYCFLLLLMLAMPNILVAQTINSGDLYISPGTTLATWGDLDNQAGGNLLNDGELFLYNHYNNNGVVSFKPTASTAAVRFQGQFGAQNISGSGTNNWNHVEFNNDKTDYSFRLSSALTVFGVANFQHGIIDNVNFNGSLTFGPDAAVQNADNGSYVAGMVTKKGNQDFVFPIGDAQKYRWASIQGVGTVSDVFSGQYFLNNPNTSYPLANKPRLIDLIDDKEYWVIHQGNATSTALVTLSWDAATSPDFVVNAAKETLHIVRWDDTNKSWVDEGGVMDTDKKQVTAITSSGYGVFTLAKVIDTYLDDLVKIHKPISPNGDGVNDYWVIEGLENFPNNKVALYNRWGAPVFETTGYDNVTNVFRGLANTGITKAKEILPVGVYFYLIAFTDDATGKRTDKSGYIYLNY